MPIADRRSSSRTCAALIHLCAALLAAILPVVAGADSPIPASAPQREEPREVKVGLYLHDVPEVDLSSGVFSFDAYLWLRWNPAQFLAPGEESGDGSTPKAPSDTYEVMGVHELETDMATSRPGYAVFRIQGKVRQNFNLAGFPLDDHRLEVWIEDSEYEDHVVKYVPDQEGSASGTFSLPGWRVSPLVCEGTVDVFETNFGDTSLPTGSRSEYSLVKFGLPIAHDGWTYFLKLTITAFIATLLALAALKIKASDLDARFGLPVGALFATIASWLIVSEELPPRSGLTIADWLHVTSLLLILVVVLESVRSLRLIYAEREEDSRLFDRATLRFLLPVYLAACAAIVWLR